MSADLVNDIVLRSCEVPLPLHKFLIQVEFRDADRELQQPATAAQALPASQLLEERWAYIPTSQIRPFHLSWEKFLQTINTTFGIDFTTETAELGWICPPPAEGLSEAYLTISNEVSFRNAIAVLQLNTSSTENAGKITLALWSPKPRLSLPESPRPVRENALASGRNPRAPVAGGGTISNTPPNLSVPPTSTLPLNPDSIDDHNPTSPPVDTDPKSRDVDMSNGGSNKGDEEEKSGPEGREEEISNPEEDEEEESNSLANINTPPNNDGTDPDTPAGPSNTEETIVDMDALLTKFGDAQNEEPTREEDEDEDDYKMRLNEWQEAKADEAVRRLQRDMETEVIMHLSEDIWDGVCRFFDHQPHLRSADYIVPVPGFRRRLLPVQAHAVYWAFLKFNGVEGSLFIGHVMGIGKTTIAFCIHHIQHRINHIHEHVQTNPERHNQTPLDKQEDNAVCPINAEIIGSFGFPCVCARSSPTSFMKKTSGFTSMLVPLGLLDNWVREARQCFPEVKDGATGGVLDCVLVKAHGSQHISEDILKQIQAKEILQEDEEKNPVRSRLRPLVSNSKFFVITVAQSFQSKVLKPLSRKRRWTYQPPPVPKKKGDLSKGYTQPRPKLMETTEYPCAIVGMQFRDEFHQEKNKGSATINAFRLLCSWQDTKRYPVRFCPMSGTPLCTGPGDMAQYIKCMVRPEWQKDHILKQWVNDEIIGISDSWDKNCKKRSMTPEFAADIVSRFTPLYERLMLRFTSTSDFLGAGPVVKVPRNKFIQVHCANPNWEERLNDATKEEDQRLAQAEKVARKRWRENHTSMTGYVPRQNNLPGSYHRQRLYASIPGLMDLQDTDGSPLRLTESEWKAKTKRSDANGDRKLPDWTKGTDSDPYFANIHMLAESSTKLQEIGKIVQRFDRIIDAEGKPARLIFASYFMPGAYIIYLYMVHVLNIPPEKISFTHKAMPEKSIGNEISKFCGSDTAPPTTRYLVGTTSTFGTGLTLNMAIGLGLLEPDFRMSAMIQYYGRHCRQGNKNKVTYTWQFLAENNDIETKIVQINDLRGKIAQVEFRKAVDDGGNEETPLVEDDEIIA